MNQARVRSGMMFAAVPPSWMIPWTRASGRSCCRHRPTEPNSGIIASSAFRPRHGSGGGVRLEAMEHDLDVLRRERLDSTWLRSHGWDSRAASMPSKSPSAIIICLAAAALLGRRAEEDDLARQLAAIGAGDRGPTPRAAIALWPHP